MKTNRELRKSAAATLKGHWGLSILAIIIFFAIIGVMGPVAGEEAFNGGHIIPSALWLTSGVSLLVAIFLVGPLEIGLYNSFRKLLVEGTTTSYRICSGQGSAAISTRYGDISC